MVVLMDIEGLRWATDVLNGQRDCPTFNKKDPVQDDSNDFAAIFEKKLQEVSRKEAKHEMH